jgi:hypothetical protein
MTDIAKRLHAATLDKDNFPRMDSERQVPVGLAKEAKAEIERLQADNKHWQTIASQGIAIERELRIEVERLRTTLGYLADDIDNPALVAVADAALRRPKP